MKSTIRHFSLCIILSCHAFAAADDKPNIVYIISDDVGYGDLGCYGATEVKTPHLDQLASGGRRFTDAHSTATVCTPTRFALLTGRYAWRQPDTGIARGDEPALIKPGTTTVASMLKQAGYKTAVIGKWHLGLGNPPSTDFNKKLAPGPLELGFDQAFVIPATGDRVPCVFVENHDVYKYDPADPIEVSFGKKIGTDPTGADPGVKLKIQGGPGHKDSVINGIPRIGFMTGGMAARWVDEDIADTITTRATGFIEANKSAPFFLLFATHDIHEPMVPHPRFRGTSTCGWRGDVIHQLDWSVGRILDTLERLNLSEKTLVIFTSDNGGQIKDTYDDGTNALHGRQKPNGILRGTKGNLYEGGHRVPFIARWPGHIPTGSTSDQLISHIDTLATLAALTSQKLATGAGSDSLNVLPALLEEKPGRALHDHLVLQNNGPSPLALRQGNWVLIEKGGVKKSIQPAVGTADNSFELYDLTSDIAQKNNRAGSEPERVKMMAELLAKIRQQP